MLIFAILVISMAVGFYEWNKQINAPPPRQYHSPAPPSQNEYRINISQCQASFNEEMRALEEQEKTSEFISYKRQKCEDALFKRNYEKAESLIDEIVDGIDLKRDAIALHFNIIKLVEKLYSIREEGPEAIDLCLKLCALDFENMENFILASNEDDFGRGVASSKRLNRPTNLVTTTRAAIIFEKQGDILSAIKICDMAIAWNAWDSGKKSFEERKARLERKLS